MSLATDGIDCLKVALGDRSYDIHIGDGAIDRAGAVLSDLLRSKNVVIVPCLLP